VTIQYAAMLSTLSNSQDLDPDYWRPLFTCNEVWHMGAQVSNSVNCVMVLHPAKTESHLSTNVKCLAKIHVPAAYMFTVINAVHFSAWLHKCLQNIE